MYATHINLNFYLTFEKKKKMDWVFRILSLLGSVDGNVKSLKRTEKNWRSESGLGSIWMLKPDAQFKNLTCSSNLEPQGNASRFERSGSINNHVQEEKVKTDTGKSWGVSISITDKILAQVPFKGAPDKRHQGPKESQWGVSTSVQSGRRDSVAAGGLARNLFDLIKTQLSDLNSSYYFGLFAQKPPLLPMQLIGIVFWVY